MVVFHLVGLEGVAEAYPRVMPEVLELDSPLIVLDGAVLGVRPDLSSVNRRIARLLLRPLDRSTVPGWVSLLPLILRTTVGVNNEGKGFGGDREFRSRRMRGSQLQAKSKLGLGFAKGVGIHVWGGGGGSLELEVLGLGVRVGVVRKGNELVKGGVGSPFVVVVLLIRPVGERMFVLNNNTSALSTPLEIHHR